MDSAREIFQLIFAPQFDYNTKVVVLGIIVYTVGCVLIGNFMILQKRSLLADVLSHATFPGIVFIFILMLIIGAVGISKNILILLLGAFFSTLFATWCMSLMQRYTVLKQDAIQASILSLFFGVGVAFLGIAQRLPIGSSAGMFTYIYGMTASMQLSDALLFLLVSSVSLVFITLKKREVTILCFDREYADSLGIPSKRLDFSLLVLVILQVIIGTQAIGLLMVSALFIVPVVVAKFWSDKLNTLILISVIVGVLCGYVGAMLSANSVNLPTGAVIVTVMEVVFVFSLFFGSKKGIFAKAIEQRRFKRKIELEHALRVMFESIEHKDESQRHIAIDDFMGQLHVSRIRAEMRMHRLLRKKLIAILGESLFLTEEGLYSATRVIRNHRLWETYLLYYTDANPEYVDYSADMVEHVLGKELTLQLEKTYELMARGEDATASSWYDKVLPSPHTGFSLTTESSVQKKGGQK